jgi:hypothetical protein
MNFLENITFRRNRTKSNSIITESTCEEIMDGSSNSLPGISQDGDTELQLIMYKEQIEKLTTELNSAHNEIELLSTENNNLKRINEDLVKKTELYKKVTQSPIPKNLTPRAKRQKKNNKQLSPPNTIKEKEHLNFSQPSSKLSRDGASSSPKTIMSEEKHKLCILSTNKRINLLNIFERNFLNKFEFCHYLTPHLDCINLLNGLDKKLSRYTMNDYCIIFIGPDDFVETKKYVYLILQLRQILLKISNTNIIICLPTYKFNNFSDMFNLRVNHFNQLLYLDVITHEHAYIFDTNKNLAYDYTMFNKKTGEINNRAMTSIIRDLYKYIDVIPYYTNYNADNYSFNNIQNTDDFFLDQ